MCALRLHSATPGWDARCGCVCLGSVFGCAPPLLAGVLGCVCAGVGALPAPRHSWLECAPWVCVFVLGFRLHPATPGLGVGVCVCLCACPPCTPPLFAGLCGVVVCVWARVSAAPRHSWLGCWGVCVLVCVLSLYPASLGWGVRLGCVCLGSGFGCAPSLLAGLLGCVCARVRAPLAPCHSWLGCAVWVCVFGLGFLLRPTTPGWGVGLCVCSCACSACTPPLLGGVRGLAVCVWARVPHAPSLLWLECWAVCVLVCALRLHQATPGTGARCGCVCLGSGFCCAPPLLDGVSGLVSACVRAPLAISHSWLGCAPWVCVFGLRLRLRPATPGLGVGLCVCWCGRSACTLSLLAGVRAGGVCVCARVSAAPRHSWLGCWGVCVLVCVPPSYSATPCWGVRCGCVCLGPGFGCAPPLLAGVLGCVCAGVRAPPVPRLSWLRYAAWVCVLGLGFWLRPVNPGLAVGLCVCSCARSACTLPLLAGVRGVGVCVWARGSAAPRHSWLGCWAVCVLVCALCLHPATPGTGARCGCVCLGSGFGCAPPLLAGLCVVGVCARARVLAAPSHSWLGFVVFGLVVAWHLFVCRGSLRVVRPLRVCGTWRPSLLGTCPCALVVAGGVPLWRASWPRVVRGASSGPVALGAPVGFPVAVVTFCTPGAYAPGFTGRLRGARGGRPGTLLFEPAAGPRRGGGAGLAPRRTRSGSRAACAAVVGMRGPDH